VAVTCGEEEKKHEIAGKKRGIPGGNREKMWNGI